MARARSAWTQAGDELLVALWPTRAAREIAVELGRTTNAIIGRARKLKLPAIPRAEINARIARTMRERQQ